MTYLAFSLYAECPAVTFRVVSRCQALQTSCRAHQPALAAIGRQVAALSGECGAEERAALCEWLSGVEGAVSGCEAVVTSRVGLCARWGAYVEASRAAEQEAEGLAERVHTLTEPELHAAFARAEQRAAECDGARAALRAALGESGVVGGGEGEFEGGREAEAVRAAVTRGLDGAAQQQRHLEERAETRERRDEQSATLVAQLCAVERDSAAVAPPAASLDGAQHAAQELRAVRARLDSLAPDRDAVGELSARLADGAPDAVDGAWRAAVAAVDGRLAVMDEVAGAWQAYGEAAGATRATLTAVHADWPAGRRPLSRADVQDTLTLCEVSGLHLTPSTASGRLINIRTLSISLVDAYSDLSGLGQIL